MLDKDIRIQKMLTTSSSQQQQ